MKKLLTLIVLGTFLLNNVSMARESSTLSAKLSRLLIENQLGLHTKSDSDLKLLNEKLVFEMRKVKSILSEMSEEAFELQKENAIKSLKNEESFDLSLLNLSENEKQSIVSSIDEETLFLAKNSDEAINLAMSSELVKIKNENILKIEAISKKELIQKIKAIDDTYKMGMVEGIHLVVTIVGMLALAIFLCPMLPTWGALLVLGGGLAVFATVKILLVNFTHVMD